MKWKPISESTNPYWDKANLYYKEKHQTVEEWVHANVPKSYWEKALKWIEKHWHVEPTDRIDLLDEQEMEDMKDDIMFFTSENFNRGQKMKWYKLYKESSDQDFVIKNGVLEKYTGKGGDVVIPNGVYSIGGYAFAECSELTSVRIPNSVEIINQRAFHRCRNLAIVRIPDSVTTIGREAFNSCYSLTRLTLGDTVKIIGSGAFAGCENLKSIQVKGKTDEEAKDFLEGAVDDLSIVQGENIR